MLTAVFVFAALLQDQVDNPEYKGWAPFKPGSSVTHKVLRPDGEQTGEQKTTLKSIDENEAVLETEFTFNGKTGNPVVRKAPAKAPAAKAGEKTGEGEEEIEIAGKKVKCKTKDFEKKLPGGKTTKLRFWINEEIPGMAAKVASIAEDGSAKGGMIAASWEKK